MDRREFLKGGSLLLIGASLAPWIFAGTDAAADASGMDAASFRQLLHSWFHVAGPAWQPVELLEVRELASTARAQQFTLVFEGVASAALAEGTYEVAPPTGSPYSLFLQPTQSGAGRQSYVATFNLLGPNAHAPACAGPA